MRRRMALMALTTLLALCLVLATLVLLSAAAGRPSGEPAWRSELARYLAQRSLQGLPPARVVSARQAGLPWQFDGGMGGVTYGAGQFHTDHTYAGAVPTPQPLPNPFVASGSARGLPLYSPGLDLHYPPDQLWCVTLQADPAGGAEPRWLVFVARHQGGIYLSGWVTHEWQGDPASPAQAALLAKVGCHQLLGDQSSYTSE